MINESRNKDSCLHLVLSAESQALQACVACLSHGDTVFFLADGVMALLDGYKEVFPRWTEAGFSATDLAARGIEAVAENTGVTIFQDEELAVLLARHRHCLSWK